MPRDTDSIFAHGAVIVPDVVTPAEEARILLRIAGAPWLAELRRRVQHYGFRYDYAGGGSHVPAPAFPRWAAAMAERIRAHFGGTLPVQCIVNEYRPGQGIGMHADRRDFGPVSRLPFARRLVADALPPPRHPSLRARRPARRRGRVAPPPLGPRPRRCRPRSLHARHRPRRQRVRDRDPRLRDLPHLRAVALRSPPPFGPRGRASRAASPSGAGKSRGWPVSGHPSQSPRSPVMPNPCIPLHRRRAVNAVRHRRRARASAPRRCAGSTCRTAGARAATGSRATSTAPAGARSSSGSHRPGTLGQMDGCGRGAAWRPARPHPPSRGRADAARGARRGPRLPRPAGCAGRGRGRLIRCQRGGAPPLAALPRYRRHSRGEAISRRGVSRAAASRRCASTPSFATAKARPCAACRRWSPP